MLPSYLSFDSSQSVDNSRECLDNHGSESASSIFTVEPYMLRTQLLILDYKQFKSARTIQRHARGFIVRKRIQRQQKSATVIQRAWRRCVAKRHLILFAQERTQESIQIMFHDSCVKIQCYFRGWWSRKYVNNMLFLKNMQLQCLEELIYAYALKLHTMLRTGHLPGYISLCEEPYSSKIADFLTILTYRFYNRYVCNKYMVKRSDREKHRRDFKAAAFTTGLPYMGFNHNSACKHWAPQYDIVPKEYDNRQYDVLQIFSTQSQMTELQKRFLEKERALRKSIRSGEKESLFCRDVANSMRFWRACDVCKHKVTDSLMGDQFKVYLSNIKLFLEQMQFVANCNCSLDKKQAELLKCNPKSYSKPIVPTSQKRVLKGSYQTLIS
ncbi:hypothetical protein AWZ03_010305 [Drosophila navojoa]|uniref:Uncharacterized protein n=1 Tax=Drosophila navojoa TaxID=7232 RepID=A0A484B3P9_DRONA|nr:uncharacterized protein LOC115563778 [Drosophila navojoa]TDG43279.1 hypothetical protein AWZ03_010305 [Drosophila navojoa]